MPRWCWQQLGIEVDAAGHLGPEVVVELVDRGDADRDVGADDGSLAQPVEVLDEGPQRVAVSRHEDDGPASRSGTIESTSRVASAAHVGKRLGTRQADRAATRNAHRMPD